MPLSFEVECKSRFFSRIVLGLFTDVDCRELRKKILSGDVQVSAIKAAVVVDPFQVATAAMKAIHSHENNKMSTKNLYSEILFNLSVSKSMVEAFRTFGVEDKDTVTVIVATNDSFDDVAKAVNGRELPMEELTAYTDIPLVKKLYKVKDVELDSGTLLDAIVTKIVAKEFMS